MSLSKRKKKLVGRLRSRRTRTREGLVLVEGPSTVAEALASGVEVRFAVVDPSLAASARTRGLMEALEGCGAPLERVSEDELARLADTETPQGVLLVCVEPAARLDDVLAGPGARILVLDAVQDPGNLGTLVRAARAFALDGVVALDGTVDPWNPKAVRAAAGTSFRIPVVGVPWSEAGPALERAETALFVAEADGRDVADVTPSPPWALVVGNEGSGPRPEVTAEARERVAVPMPGGAESLNAGVAGAVLLYALTRPGRP